MEEMSTRLTVIAIPSYSEHVASPLHRAGYYAQVQGTSRSITEHRRALSYVQDAVRDLPPPPSPDGHWSNVEQVKRMVFSSS